MDHLTLGDPSGDAGCHRALKDAPKLLCSPALPDPGQARVIGQGLVQPIACKPANGQVDLRFPHEPAVVDDAQQEARQHQPDRDLWIDTRSPIVRAVQLPDLATQPAQIENLIDADQDVILGKQLAQ